MVPVTAGDELELRVPDCVVVGGDNGAAPVGLVANRVASRGDDVFSYS